MKWEKVKLGELYTVHNGLSKILHSDGYGRGMVYHICGTSNDECDLFNSRFSSSPEKGPSSPEKGPSSPEKGPSSPEKGPSSELERGGCQPLPKLNKIKKDCLSLFLTYGELSAAELRTKLKRNNPAKFRNNILSPLMEIGFVVATLQPPQHPKQKYKMTDEGRAFMIHLNATSGLNN